MSRRGWTAALILAVLLAGCSGPTNDIQGTQMSSPQRTQQRVDWDLSVPRTPVELGGRSVDVVAAETLGVNGLDVAITLPGGDTATGSFGLVTGDTGGGAGPVRYLALATTALPQDAADASIDSFIERFGGDRAVVTAFLDEIRPGPATGDIAPGRTFPGDDRPGYRPALQVRPAPTGLVVAWHFALTP